MIIVCSISVPPAKDCRRLFCPLKLLNLPMTMCLRKQSAITSKDQQASALQLPSLKMSCHLGLYYHYLSYLLSGSILFKTKTLNETLSLQNSIFSESALLKKVRWTEFGFLPYMTYIKNNQKWQLQIVRKQLHSRHNQFKCMVENDKTVKS